MNVIISLLIILIIMCTAFVDIIWKWIATGVYHSKEFPGAFPAVT